MFKCCRDCKQKKLFLCKKSHTKGSFAILATFAVPATFNRPSNLYMPTSFLRYSSINAHKKICTKDHKCVYHPNPYSHISGSKSKRAKTLSLPRYVK